jgi:hypothetical protein
MRGEYEPTVIIYIALAYTHTGIITNAKWSVILCSLIPYSRLVLMIVRECVYDIKITVIITFSFSFFE